MQLKGILDSCRDKNLEIYKQNLDARIESYRPIFEEYLNGMLVSEIAKKHNTTRYQVYSLLTRYGIPRRPESDLFLLQARRLLNQPCKRKRFEKDNCECFVCSWIRDH